MSQLNKYSSHVTQPKIQGASQAMLYGTGMTEEDMGKAQVGIGSAWILLTYTGQSDWGHGGVYVCVCVL